MPIRTAAFALGFCLSHCTSMSSGISEHSAAEQTLCGYTCVASGQITIVDPIDRSTVGEGTTDDVGGFCVTARPALGAYEICASDGSYVGEDGSYSPMVDGQRYCTAWYGAAGEAPKAPLYIDWISHAAYVRFRWLLDSGIEPVRAWGLASNDIDRWGACATGGSVVTAKPISPTQARNDVPVMSAGLSRGVLRTIMDMWPTRLNERLHDGERVLTPSILVYHIVDRDLADGTSNGLGVDDAQITIPGSDYALGHGTLRWAVGGVVEALVGFLRSHLNQTGITDRSSLPRCLCAATGGIFELSEPRPCDIEGPAATVVNMTSGSVIDDEFDLVVDFSDDVAITGARIVTGDNYCYSVLAEEPLDCEDHYNCRLVARVSVDGCGPGEVQLAIIGVDAHGNTSRMDFSAIKNQGGPHIVVDPAFDVPLSGNVQFTAVAADPQGCSSLKVGSNHPGLSCDRSQATTTESWTLPCTLDTTADVDGSYGLGLMASNIEGVGATLVVPFSTNNYDSAVVTAIAHMETPCRAGTCRAYVWQLESNGTLLASAAIGDDGRCELELPDSFAGAVEIVAADCISYSPALSRELTAATGSVLSTLFRYHPPALGMAYDEPTLAINRITSSAVHKTRALHRAGLPVGAARDAAYSDWEGHVRPSEQPFSVASAIGVDLSDPDALASANNQQITVALFEYALNRRAATWARGLDQPIDIGTWAGTAFLSSVIAREYETDTLLDGLSNGSSIVLGPDSSIVLNSNALRFGISVPAYDGLRGAPLPGGIQVGDDIGLVADEWYPLFEHWATVQNSAHFGLIAE